MAVYRLEFINMNRRKGGADITSEENKIGITYKCCVLVRRSSPGVVAVEIGIDPVSWLSARSNQLRFVSKPSEAGILPVNLFEFSALKRMRDKIS